jgi:hypothetical protein
MKRSLIRGLLCLVMAFLPLIALADGEARVYRGTVGERAVTFYVVENINQCTGEAIFYGMYRYEGKSLWLQLDITVNDKRQFVMVENGFTGVLMLKEAGGGMNGQWLSPDHARTLPVMLKPKKVSAKETEALEKQYEETNYQNHDC